MEQSSPSQPQVITYRSHIVEHRECMIEIVLVTACTLSVYAPQCCQTRKYQVKQPCTVEQFPADRRLGRSHYLVELIGYAFT